MTYFGKNVIELTDLVLADSVALDKYPQIVDKIVRKAHDQKRIKEFFYEAGKYYEAVLESLRIWQSYGAQGVELIGVLHELGLNALADNITADTVKDSSNIWFEVGEVVYNFTGRESELLTVHRMMHAARSQENTLKQIICISGLGGVGKSTLVRKYAFENKNYYKGNVIWIHADSEDSMQKSFLRLAKRLRLQADENVRSDEICFKIYSKLKEKEACLLIFDNVEKKEELKRFLPKVVDPFRNPLHILVTSRRAELTPIQENRLTLAVFTMPEALTFIKNQVKAPSNADAEKLADTLQRLPLALQQAVVFILDAYLDEDPESISQYLKEFDLNAQTLLDDDKFQEDNEYNSTVLTTWKVTLTRVRGMEHGPEAISLIHTLAYLAPDRSSVEFLGKMYTENLVACLKLLQRFSLLTVRRKLCDIHRLVQHVVRLSLDSSDEGTVIETIGLALQKVLSDQGFHELSSECAAHGLYIFPFLVKNPANIIRDLSFIIWLCEYWGMHGNGVECGEITKLGLIALHSVDHDVVKEFAGLTMEYWTAFSMHSAGDTRGAYKTLKTLLPRISTAYGDDHPFSLSAYGTAATLCSTLKRFNEASEILEILIPKLETKILKLGFAPAKRMAKAWVLARQGKMDEAQLLEENIKGLFKAKRNEVQTQAPFPTLVKMVTSMIPAVLSAQNMHDRTEAMKVVRALCAELHVLLRKENQTGVYMDAHLQGDDESMGAAELVRFLESALRRQESTQSTLQEEPGAREGDPISESAMAGLANEALNHVIRNTSPEQDELVIRNISEAISEVLGKRLCHADIGKENRGGLVDCLVEAFDVIKKQFGDLPQELVTIVMGLAKLRTTNIEDGSGARDKTSVRFYASQNQFRSVDHVLGSEGNVNKGNNKRAHTAVHKAAYDGTLDRLQTLVQSGVDLCTIDEDNRTPLDYAILRQHIHVVKYLLEVGVDVNAAGGRKPALFHAIDADSLQLIKLLVAAGAPLEGNCDYQEGLTPLHYAVYYSTNQEIVKYLATEARTRSLLDNVAGLAGTPLYTACIARKSEFVEILVESGADVHIPTSGAQTSLCKAAENGDLSILKCLLDEGADVDAGKWNPLITAVHNRQLDAVKYLFERGAMLTGEYPNGEPFNVDSLLIAAVQSQWDILKSAVPLVEYLVEVHGADPSATDLHGNNVISIAALSNQWDVVTHLNGGIRLQLHEAVGQGDMGAVNCILKEARIPIDEAGPINMTPLQLAAHTGHSDIVRVLIENGSDVTGSNFHASVLHFACSSSSNDNVLTLVLDGLKKAFKTQEDFMAHVNGGDSDGDTPLDWTIESRKLEMARILIDAGADPRIKNNAGENSFDWARKVADTSKAQEFLELLGPQLEAESLDEGETEATDSTNCAKSSSGNSANGENAVG